MKNIFNRDYTVKGLTRNLLVVLALYLFVVILNETNITNFSEESMTRFKYLFIFSIVWEVIIVSVHNSFKKK